MKVDAQLLAAVADIARTAAAEIMEVYTRDEALAVSNKSDDSPLTEADLRAHRVIVAALQQLTPDWPVLSEESADIPLAERLQWSCYWLVDPLDGTKEFIGRNGEFTVNIALIRDGQPVLGVVQVPVTGVSYQGICSGGADDGAWREQVGEPRAALQAAAPQGSTLRVVASRRHGSDALQRWLDVLAQQFPDLQKVSMGSSLKICMLAGGAADIYPRLAPTSEWDTAAAHAVLRAAGGEIYDTDFRALRYNKAEGILNPHFIAVADARINWAARCAPAAAE